MKIIGLICALVFMSSCTALLKCETKKDDQNVIIEKEFYIGPKIGKE